MSPASGRSGGTRRTTAQLRQDPDLLAVYEFMDLVAASARSALQRDRIARALGAPMTTASLSALRVIDRSGPLSTSELARRLGLDQSTVSRQVRPLEEATLITKSVDPTDARSARLAINARGRRLLDQARDVVLNDCDVALRHWSPAERSQLGSLLERLRHDLLAVETDPSGWSVETPTAEAG